MQEKILFETDYYKITHSEQGGFVHFKRIGFNSLNQVQEASQKLLDALYQTGVKKYLVDDTETKVTPQDAQNWLIGDFAEKIPTYIEKMAWVNSKDVFQQAVVQKYAQPMEEFSQERGVEIQVFKTVEEATIWLLED